MDKILAKGATERYASMSDHLVHKGKAVKAPICCRVAAIGIRAKRLALEESQGQFYQSLGHYCPRGQPGRSKEDLALWCYSRPLMFETGEREAGVAWFETVEARYLRTWTNADRRPHRFVGAS